MTEGKRPGGLTALAVLNLCGGAFDVLGVLGLTMTCLQLNVPEFAEKIPMNEEGRRVLDIWRELGNGPLYALIGATAVLACLLIASGIGYLRQKRFLGRKVGNAYALVSLVTTLAWATLIEQKELGGGVEIITILAALYPVLTLILLNTTFKEDFVR